MTTTKNLFSSFFARTFLIGFFIVFFFIIYVFYDFFPQFIFCEDNTPLTKEQMVAYLDYISLTYKVDYLTEVDDKNRILEATLPYDSKTLHTLKLRIIDYIIYRAKRDFVGFRTAEFELFVKRYQMLFDGEFKDITTVRRVAAYVYYNQGVPY